MQYCRIISLDNNNSVKYTSSRGDNSTTKDSMVMKIAHAQLYMYTNIMYKFQSNTCKTVGEKHPKKFCPQTDRHENCICTTSYTHKHCVNFKAVLAKMYDNALDNNDLVKFTSSRRDNSATNDSMVMKIAHGELYTTSNIVCNFEFNTCNTVGLFEKSSGQNCVHRQMDSHGDSSITPSTSLWGYN